MADPSSPTNRQPDPREEAEIRNRDEKRRKEEDERKRRAEAERLAEEKRQKDEKARRVEEERRRQKQEEEWKKLGTDVIAVLPPVPSSFTDDHDPLGLKAWYVDDEVAKPTLRMASLKKGRKSGAPRVTLSNLRELGIVYFRINLNDFSVVNQIVKERLYKHTDEIRVSQTCKDEQFLERWFQEHYNEDEQVRLVTDGSCFFDVRSKQDTWIRVHAQAGDLLVFAPGLYHRGTLDENDYVAMLRVFRDAQRFAPLFRADKRADAHPSRLQYLKMLKKGNVASEIGMK
ncbi:acireductone dioxygenase-like protein, putative [Bodo saltans]|uniref:Acireductone dioxygenase-like protein, putative n=1 Tax=Bodo saltans TaxID=75058 RepID=A0A0S4IQB1_BODSA|nr:acireductone dioxygenase-like protein, putative [Bodo saltans]|eukprot:CUF11034.1 acireductone dioxygenase-like protein, putative [Bodo saltans]